MTFLTNRFPRLISLPTSAIFVSGTIGVTAILKYRSVNPISFWQQRVLRILDKFDDLAQVVGVAMWLGICRHLESGAGQIARDKSTSLLLIWQFSGKMIDDSPIGVVCSLTDPLLPLTVASGWLRRHRPCDVGQ